MAIKKNTTPALPTPLLVTAKELARISGIGENKIRQLMDEGELEYLTIGKHRLLRPEAILDYYERHKAPVLPRSSPLRSDNPA